MKPRSSLVACCVLWVATAHSADIYQWVDEQGRTQVSDTVPDEYKSTARKFDSQSFELSPQQRSEAEAAAAKEKESAAKAQAERQAAGNRESTDAEASAQDAPSAESPTPESDCATLQRLFAESQECFAPYRVDNGAVRPEAFQNCTELPDPTPKCGLPTMPR